MKEQKITACAFLHKDNKLFIAKRADTKSFLPGKFELPGGHVEYGEDLLSGLQREFMEEFGIKIKVGDPFFAFTYFRDDAHVVEIDYFAELEDPNQEIKLNPEDHSESRWITRAELDSVWDKNDDEYKAITKGFEMLDKIQHKK